MSEHKFRIGQAVEIVPSRRFDRPTGGRYTIVRLLPAESNMPQYRIRNATDGRERVVHEGEIGSR